MWRWALGLTFHRAADLGLEDLEWEKEHDAGDHAVALGAELLAVFEQGAGLVGLPSSEAS